MGLEFKVILVSPSWGSDHYILSFLFITWELKIYVQNRFSTEMGKSLNQLISKFWLQKRKQLVLICQTLGQIHFL